MNKKITVSDPLSTKAMIDTIVDQMHQDYMAMDEYQRLGKMIDLRGRTYHRASISDYTEWVYVHPDELRKRLYLAAGLTAEGAAPAPTRAEVMEQFISERDYRDGDERIVVTFDEIRALCRDYAAAREG